MANRYFRGAAASWNVATNWSTTNGGPADAAVPTAVDNVFITSLSFATLTLSTTGGVCASIDFTGWTGTWTGSSSCTVSGNVTLSAAMTITWSGALIVNATASLRSNGKTLLGNFQFTAAGTYTLLDDWRTNAQFSSSVGTKVINGFTIYVGGTLTMPSNITTSGTTNFVMNGTGTLSSNSATNGIWQNNITINTAGIITLATNIVFNTGTFRYIAGTIINTGSTLTCPTATIPTTTFDTGTMVWNNITLTGTGPYTLLSNLLIGGSFSSLTNSKTINGFTIYVSGSLLHSTATTVTEGTTNIVLNGTGTWSSSASGQLRNNVTINTLGIITLGTNIAFNTGILTYVKGTVISTGNTMTVSGGTGIETKFDLTRPDSTKMMLNNLTFSGSMGIYTLLSDIWLAGNYTSGGTGSATQTRTINGFTMYIGGGITITAYINTTGTTHLVLNGTGNWTGSAGGANRQIQNNLTIDTDGIITLTTDVSYNTGTLRYVKGTVISAGMQLYICYASSNVTLDTGGMEWSKVAIPSSAISTIILLSTLRVGDFLLGASSNTIFSGVAGFTVFKLALSSPTTQQTVLLTPGLPYIITNEIGTNATGQLDRQIKSTIPGTRATLTLNEGAICLMGFYNFTDIDASGGRTIYTFMGIVVNCININAFGDPVRTIAKSFIG